jgi:hypothetical protein
LTEALWDAREDNATLAIPRREAIGLGLPVDTPSILSCRKVVRAKEDAKAAYPAMMGSVLGGRLNVADKAMSAIFGLSPAVIANDDVIGLTAFLCPQSTERCLEVWSLADALQKMARVSSGCDVQTAR